MFNFFDVLIPFLMIHIICDFYLQPNQWVEAKKKNTYRSTELYFHSLLHGVASLVPARALGIDWRSTVCLVVIIAVSHFLIDLWKVSARNGGKFSYFIIDQTLHVVVLAAIAFHMADGVTIDAVLQHEQFSDGVMVVFAYLLILKPTSIVIGSVLRKYPISSADNDNSISGLIAGGELIGYLERVLILTFTLVGSYAAVGFVLAAKSIFRFGELNKSDDRSMTEYVLIGSLLSVVITTLVGTLMSLGLDVKIK
ncbi:DUF3307 domain-containing protein [Vibrio lentus]|uniref:DUF3307 domain-containing protein n=1 Tax=Vibrio lentus TaxID=136468 RepID=A0AB36XJX9_9VIBR|nr:DUF3307 domain-containing protein [Vibrio lentus]MCC4840170.1 DUF3307 domain-containing protein [Vibrio lentus]PMI13287.1 hypothetical protein BCU51_22530 [Vibrio lentus]PMK31291.1 hypothetical protein BCU02_25545 [Vibrio lentus]PMK45207.1 hypothetical protein BCT99_23720 [Vibrio lentus]PML27792.1 hypothetical protein BCT79_25985 [Vibrio lentus]